MAFVSFIFLPIVAALFIPFLNKQWKSIHTGWFVLLIPVSLFIYYLQFVKGILNGEVHISELPWIPSFNISFTGYMDGLSVLFSLLITGIGALVVLYSIFYLNKEREQLHTFYVYLLMFMTAMLGIVQSDNVISLYLFWELTSISSFLLIGYWFTKDRSRFGALKSMIITVFGGLMMLGGLILLSIMGGSYSIRELIANASQIAGHEYFTLAIVLILLGAFTKSAQFPFYIWLPDAMEAPTPVSAYLHSATMVKAGLYLVARFTPVFASSEVWIWLVTGIGLLTLFWGSFFAVKQTDLKAILAFSTVSQLGLIMSLLGASAMAYHVSGESFALFKIAAFAAIFHLINHAMFKGSLFMVAGIVDVQTGTRDIRKLGGLMGLMPLSFTVAFIGSMSMAGLPPFGGFLSKELFLTSMLSLREFNLFHFDTWGTVFLIVAWIASVFTFVYSFYFVFKTFAGRQKSVALPKAAKEAPIGMLLSPIILALIVIVIFFIPNLVGKVFVNPAVLALQEGLYKHPSDIGIEVAIWHGWTPELMMTLGIIGLGVLLYVTMARWQKLYDIQPQYFSLNALYDSMMLFGEAGMNKLSRFYMTGLLRSYLFYMFFFIVTITTGALFIQDAFAVDFESFAPLNAYGFMTAVIIIIAISMVLFAKTRLSAIIALGAVGYSVALFFVIYKAPDLALTQLVIETVSVALFLLAFRFLPEVQRHGETKKIRFGNFIIAAAVGVTVTLVALSAHSQKLVPSISQYYKDTVFTEAAGGNIVNVILVDYRGFDTLFEIAVLGIAAIGVYAMVKLRLSRKENSDESK